MAQPKVEKKKKKRKQTKNKKHTPGKPQTNKAGVQSGQMYLDSTENQKKLGGHLFFFFFTLQKMLENLYP